MKKWIATIWLTLLMGVIIAFFWYNQLVYSMPTPVPINYHTVQTGQPINLEGLSGFKSDKPVFLHFFNPECPCSRFNIEQFRNLVKEYHNEVDFAVILLSEKSYTQSDIQTRFGISVPVYSDSTLAAVCGVYSTPQAVLLKQDRALFYRGNYNKSRYCTDMKTNYAKIAIEGLISHKSSLTLDKYALKAYGCTLPNCNK